MWTTKDGSKSLSTLTMLLFPPPALPPAPPSPPPSSPSSLSSPSSPSSPSPPFLPSPSSPSPSSSGGYALSTAVCQNNRTLDEMSTSMQLHHPSTQHARASALDYLSGVRRSCSKTLFVFRQPQKIELRKYSSTCVFLKRLLHQCGYVKSALMIHVGGTRVVISSTDQIMKIQSESESCFIQTFFVGFFVF
jgi:hypothetical protein